jgi:hypothetical protein
MEIINLTPHDIDVYGIRLDTLEEGPIFTYPASGKVARIAVIELGTQQGPDVWYEMVQYGHLEGLPPKEEGNEKGTIIGCRYLQMVC